MELVNNTYSTGANEYISTQFGSDLMPRELSIHTAWNKAKEQLRFKLGEATYNSWIKDLEVKEFTENYVTLSCNTRFIKEWVLSNYIDEILTAFKESDSSVKYIDIVAVRRAEGEKKREEQIQAVSYESVKENNYELAAELSLDDRLTFDNFVKDTSNELAYSAARAVANAQSGSLGANPLYLYSGVGLGKTHLMQALAHEMLSLNPNARVAYLSAEKFMFHFVRALKNKNIVAFKEYFRSLDLLLVDDIQFICGKNSTQEEFFHTFNSLFNSGCKIVLSANEPASNLPKMTDSLKDRINGGLMVGIGKSSYDLRKSVLENKFEYLKKSQELEGVELPFNVTDYIAENITSSIREIEGALTKLVVHSSMTKQPITLELVVRILEDNLTKVTNVTIDYIKKEVADIYAISTRDIVSKKRTKNITRPRQIAMYFSKKYTQNSLLDIGVQFGGKDHTTVMHSVKRIEELLDSDAQFAEELKKLEQRLF